MRIIFVAALALLGSQVNAAAADWPGWRGPMGNGVAEGRGYPVEWSANSNVKWKFAIDGPGASTPAVWDDHIFLTSTSGGKNQVTCIDFDGKQVWKKSLGASLKGKHKVDGTGANPSPVVDGEHVFVYFKSGDFGCFSPEGDLQWQVNLFQKYTDVTTETLWWDLGTSPVRTKDAIVVTMMHTGPSYLVAFDPATGQELWKHDRVTNAPQEAAQSYTTPVVTTNRDGKEVIIVSGADYVTCHDANGGAELWRVGSLNPEGNGYFRSISSSVAGDGYVIVPYARGGTLTCIRMGGQGDVTESHVAWTNQNTAADVPTPVVSGNRIFVLRDKGNTRGTVDCLELDTGETIWSGRLEKHRESFRSSPILAEGRLYITRQDGTVFVVDASGDEFRVIAKNRIADEHTVATPVFVNGRILLRTVENIYLIGS